MGDSFWRERAPRIAQTGVRRFLIGGAVLVLLSFLQAASSAPYAYRAAARVDPAAERTAEVVAEQARVRASLQTIEAELRAQQLRAEHQRSLQELQARQQEQRIADLHAGVSRFGNFSSIALMIAGLMVIALMGLLVQRMATERKRISRIVGSRLREAEKQHASRYASMRAEFEHKLAALRTELGDQVPRRAARSAQPGASATAPAVSTDTHGAAGVEAAGVQDAGARERPTNARVDEAVAQDAVRSVALPAAVAAPLGMLAAKTALAQAGDSTPSVASSKVSGAVRADAALDEVAAASAEAEVAAAPRLAEASAPEAVVPEAVVPETVQAHALVAMPAAGQSGWSTVASTASDPAAAMEPASPPLQEAELAVADNEQAWRVLLGEREPPVIESARSVVEGAASAAQGAVANSEADLAEATASRSSDPESAARIAEAPTQAESPVTADVVHAAEAADVADPAVPADPADPADIADIAAALAVPGLPESVAGAEGGSPDPHATVDVVSDQDAGSIADADEAWADAEAEALEEALAADDADAHADAEAAAEADAAARWAALTATAPVAPEGAESAIAGGMVAVEAQGSMPRDPGLVEHAVDPGVAAEAASAMMSVLDDVPVAGPQAPFAGTTGATGRVGDSARVDGADSVELPSSGVPGINHPAAGMDAGVAPQVAFAMEFVEGDPRAPGPPAFLPGDGAPATLVVIPAEGQQLDPPPAGTVSVLDWDSEPGTAPVAAGEVAPQHGTADDGADLPQLHGPSESLAGAQIAPPVAVGQHLHAVQPIELVEVEPSAFLPYRDQDSVALQSLAVAAPQAIGPDVDDQAVEAAGAPEDLPASLLGAPTPGPAANADRETFELSANETLPPVQEGVLRTGDTFSVRMLTDSRIGLQDPTLHETLDPTPREPAAPLGPPLFESVTDDVRARLMRLELRDDLRQVLNQVPELLRALVQQALGVLLKPESARSALDWRLLVLDAWRRGNYEESLARTEAMGRVAQDDQERIQAALQRGLVLEKLRRFPEALTAFDDASSGAVAQSTTGDLPPEVAEALLHRGLVLRREFHDFEGTRGVLRTLVERFGHRTAPPYAGLVVRGLVNLGLVEAAADGNLEEALALYARVQRDFAGSDDRQVQTSVAQAQFNRAVLLYERRQDVDGALGAYQQIADHVARGGDADASLLVANALANQAWLLARKRRDIPAALATYRELDRRFGEQRDRDIALIVARGLFAAAALTAQELRAPRAAAELYAELVRRYELFADAEFSLLVAKAQFNLAAIRGALPGSEEEGIAAYDGVVERYAVREELVFGEWVAGALVNKAGLVARGGDVPRALETYWQAVREFGQRSESGIAEQAAKALLNIGALSNQIGDADGAIAAYQEIGRRYAGAEDARIALIVARATGNLASLLASSRQDIDGALRSFGELVSRVGNRTEPEFIEQCARALFSMGVLLGGTRRDPDGAIATYDVLAQRYGDRTEPAVMQQVVKGLFNQAALQAREQRDLRAALNTLDALLARYGDVDDPMVAERIVSAMVNKARIERMNGSRERAHATFERVVQRFGQHDEPQIRKHVDAARRALGEDLAA